MYWSDVAWSGWCASALFTSRIVCSQHDRWRYCQWYEFLCTKILLHRQADGAPMGFGLLHRQAARGAECIWRLGVPPLPTLPTISFLLHRQAARGAGLSDGWYTLLTAEVTLPTFDGYMPVWPYLFSYCTVRPIRIWCLYGKWQYLSSEIWRLE